MSERAWPRTIRSFTMTAPLMQASRQWAIRPADQRFTSLTDLHAAVTHHREVAAEQKGVALRNLRVVTEQDAEGIAHPVLGTTTTDKTAQFTHFSFGQLARKLGAPASYLRELPAELVTRNLNHGLAKAAVNEVIDDESHSTLLFAQNGNLVLRALTSDKYTRIWNSDVTARLIKLTQDSPEWQPAPAAFDGSRGLYASEKDVFAFMVDDDRRIFETLPGGGLSRGFFISNSEVGDASFSLTTFLYQYVCGNHMVWGAQGVKNIRIPHIGDADTRAFRNITIELRKYASESAVSDEVKLRNMIAYEFKGTKDEVLDTIFKQIGQAIPKQTIGAAIDISDKSEDRYGTPRTAFSIVSGLTEIARDKVNADERVKLEKAAGKVAQIAFA
jgi:hypothetical protein